ncbi:PH domain-containing protein [Corynebacterium alimapuense]|uniref:Low molecular weight protein antigen 6 PH domain-containing protein n=1 Tax=Corynebacterium alimapuense TaxID=1576874 RepID=A0A3M8K7S9_9CORY|nr:PH domain-containing protein [Corynebacterium alimapuense]RNE49206.1 hypothetical protein C5L39_02160 [Corynebacterium alimapuense]
MKDNAVDAENNSRKSLTDQELAVYNALDPHAVTTTQPWEFEVRSRYLRKIAWICVVVVMVIHLFMGAVVDVEFTGAAVTTIDKFAFPLVGVVISVLAYLSFTRPRVRANSDGVEVRNIVGTRFYPWTVIYGLSFPQGSRMARLELPEFEYVPMWAIQAGDGQSAISAVSEFRELEAAYMPQD